jgi:hypothetical protein
MMMFKRGCAVLLVTLASACSSDSITTTAPIPTPVDSPTLAPANSPGEPFVLTGQVTDRDTSAPIAGATVWVDFLYKTTTDSSGHYSLTGRFYYGQYSFTYVSANDYVVDYRYIRAFSQNVRLYRIEGGITAGDSKDVTVAPDDSLCVNNEQDAPGWGPALGQGYVCRSVRVVAPSDGVMTLEAVSTQGGAHPLLEVEAVRVSPCCSERIGNPTSIQVTAGTEVIASVEMIVGSTTSQSFRLSTSMSGK